MYFIKCKECKGLGYIDTLMEIKDNIVTLPHKINCTKCKCTGYIKNKYHKEIKLQHNEN